AQRIFWLAAGPAAQLLRCDDGIARYAADRLDRLLGAGRAELSLWRVPCRRAGPRQGGDLVLYAGQRNTAAAGGDAERAVGPAPIIGGRGVRAGCCRAAGVDQHGHGRRGALDRRGLLRAGGAAGPVAGAAQVVRLGPWAPSPSPPGAQGACVSARSP